MTLAILPYPRSLQIKQGSCAQGELHVVAESAEFEAVARYLREQLPQTGDPVRPQIMVRLLHDTGLTHSEAYQLQIDASSISIRAGGPAGAFYGGQSLLQLITSEKGAPLPALLIDDEPSYHWRGMHLDCSRHFFDIAFIKRYLDLLAQHKMNRFHWHLCDDQGWRLQSERFPRLTSIGAWRERSVVGHTANRERQYEARAYGGFYSQDEVREVVAYAAQRHIEVIPEIDIPGHAAALLAAYPELSCDCGDYQVEEHYGIFPDVLCPCEETFEFLQALFTEIAGLFPFEYVHIGGDEVIKNKWRECQRCCQLMQQQGMTSVDQLHGYFVARVETILADLGRRAIGWDEVMDGEVDTRTTIMCWTGFDACRRALEAGHETIMTPVECTYFDFYQSTSLDEPQAIHGLATLRHVFDYDPLPDGVDESLRPNILGVQANVWTEYLRSEGAVEYACLPRMSALSEVAWTGAGRSWTDFCERLPVLLERLESAGFNVAHSAYKPRIEVNQGSSAALQVAMHCEMPGMDIHYTTDGSEPGLASPRYKAPLQITRSCIVRCRAWRNGQAYGDARQHLAVHAGLHRPVFWWQDNALSEAPELSRLSNGCLGDERIFHDFEWTQFTQTESDLVLDLGESQPVTGVHLNFEAGAHRELFFPSALGAMLSEDGQAWYQLCDVPGEAIEQGRIHLHWPARKGRYLRLRIENKDKHYSPEQRCNITRPVHLDELRID